MGQSSIMSILDRACLLGRIPSTTSASPSMTDHALAKDHSWQLEHLESDQRSQLYSYRDPDLFCQTWEDRSAGVVGQVDEEDAKHPRKNKKRWAQEQG